MIDKSLILKEIAQLRDIVDLGVCVGVYQTCNGKAVQAHARKRLHQFFESQIR